MCKVSDINHKPARTFLVAGLLSWGDTKQAEPIITAINLAREKKVFFPCKLATHWLGCSTFYDQIKSFRTKKYFLCSSSDVYETRWLGLKRVAHSGLTVYWAFVKSVFRVFMSKNTIIYWNMTIY